MASSRCARCAELDVVCEYPGRNGKGSTIGHAAGIDRDDDRQEQGVYDDKREDEVSQRDGDVIDKNRISSTIITDDDTSVGQSVDDRRQRLIGSNSADAADSTGRRRSEAVSSQTRDTFASRRISAPIPAAASSSPAEAGPGPRTITMQQQRQRQRQREEEERLEHRYQQQQQQHAPYLQQSIQVPAVSHDLTAAEHMSDTSRYQQAPPPPPEPPQSWMSTMVDGTGPSQMPLASESTTDQLLLLADTAAQNHHSDNQQRGAATESNPYDFATSLSMGLGVVGVPSELPDSIFDWGMIGWSGGSSVGDIFQPLNTQAPNTPVAMYPLPPQSLQGFVPTRDFDPAQRPPFLPDTASMGAPQPPQPAPPQPPSTARRRAAPPHRRNGSITTPGSIASPASGSTTFASSSENHHPNAVLPREIPDGQPHDTPWPHVYKPQTADTNIDLPRSEQVDASAFAEAERSHHASAASSSHPSPIAAGQNVLPETNRQAMLSLIRMCHQGPIWSEPDVGRFPSTTTLSVCVDLYFRHFQPCLPILDPATFDLTTAPPVLVMAIAAIGSMYSQDGLRNLGVALNEIVRRSIIFIVSRRDAKFEQSELALNSHLQRLSANTIDGSCTRRISCKPGYSNHITGHFAARPTCINTQKSAEAA